MTIIKNFHAVRLFIAFFILLSACRPQDVALIGEQKFFDINGLLQEQIMLLDSLNPELHKVAFLANDRDTTVFRPDSSGWLRELQIFMELDINRPVLWDRYVENRMSDTVGNLEIISYELMDNGGSGVRYLNIFLSEGEVSQIEGKFLEKSILYDASRTLSIYFDPRPNFNRIKNYSIFGKQKIILKDTVFYQMMAEIIYSE